MGNRLTPLATAVALLSATGAIGQTKYEEPSAIVEIGGAGEWELQGGGTGFGPSLAVESTIIENWLEVELGTAPLFSHGRTEWDTDFLFKKPYTLSDEAEFMFGLGPSWSHASGSGRSRDALGLEAALDFMFWPWSSRPFGWFLEPSYGYNFRDGQHSLAISIGLLVSIP